LPSLASLLNNGEAPQKFVFQELKSEKPAQNKTRIQTPHEFLRGLFREVKIFLGLFTEAAQNRTASGWQGIRRSALQKNKLHASCKPSTVQSIE
jgi:hypothetical protein